VIVGRIDQPKCRDCTPFSVCIECCKITNMQNGEMFLPGTHWKTTSHVQAKPKITEPQMMHLISIVCHRTIAMRR
jgi:hypothetical protein